MKLESGLKTRIAHSGLSIAAGLLLAALLIQISGYNASEAFSALWIGATGLQSGSPVSPSDIPVGAGHLNLFLLAQSLARATPLLFCGLAVAIGLRAGLFNIGAQGQMTVGAMAGAATGLAHLPIPPVLHMILALMAGAFAGGVWGVIPGLLKAWRGVHEVLSTIMLNFIGINLVTYLASHNLRDPNSQNPQTAQIDHSLWLQPLVAHSNLTIGALIATACALATPFLLSRTPVGFQIRATGLNPDAAKASGISIPRTLAITMAISGALAGLAGAIEVIGIHHRYVDGVAGTYGFDGIAVALLGGAGGGAILSALFFGFLSTGSDYMQSLTHVPAPVAVVVQAIVILFVGIKTLNPTSVQNPFKKRKKSPS